MATVSTTDRREVKHRDGSACVSCGALRHLTMQHRARVGAGGTSLRVGRAGLLTACAFCNARYEGDMQTEALVYGWKVRSWVKEQCVPVFFKARGIWVVLGVEKGLTVISPAEAVRMMREVYGEQWEKWARSLRVQVGLEGLGI